MHAGKAFCTASLIIALIHLGFTSAAAESITTTVSATILSIESGPIDSAGHLVDTNFGVLDEIDLFTVQYDDKSQLAHYYSGNFGFEIHKDYLYPLILDFVSDAVFSFSQPIQEILSRYPNERSQNPSYSVVQGTGPYFQFDIVEDAIGQFEGKWAGTGSDALSEASLRTWYSDGASKVTLLFGAPSWVSSNPIPEPATVLLFGTGLIGLAGAKRRKTKKA